MGVAYKTPGQHIIDELHEEGFEQVTYESADQGHMYFEGAYGSNIYDIKSQPSEYNENTTEIHVRIAGYEDWRHLFDIEDDEDE